MKKLISKSNITNPHHSTLPCLNHINLTNVPRLCSINFSSINHVHQEKDKGGEKAEVEAEKKAKAGESSEELGRGKEALREGLHIVEDELRDIDHQFQDMKDRAQHLKDRVSNQ